MGDKTLHVLEKNIKMVWWKN